MKYRVHLIGLTKEEPRITREFDMAVAEPGWLICWNLRRGDRRDQRWYPAQGVISVEAISGPEQAEALVDA